MGAEAVRTLASLFVRCTASVPPFVEPMLAENIAGRPTLEDAREAFREIAARFVRRPRGSQAHPRTSER